MMAPKEVENLSIRRKIYRGKMSHFQDFQYYCDRIHAPGSRMNISIVLLAGL